MDVFEQIRRTYALERDRGRLDAAIAQWRSGDSVWESVPDLRALERLCHEATETEYELRNDVLIALCREVAKDEHARVALCGLFLPGLLDVRRRFSEQTALDAQDLSAEIVANFWAAVRLVAPGDTRIPQRLVNAALFRTMRAVRRASRTRSFEEPADLEKILEALEERPNTEGSETAPVELGARLRRAVEEGVIGDLDARLLLAPRGFLTRVALQFGVSHRNARARRLLARRRLCAWASEREHEARG